MDKKSYAFGMSVASSLIQSGVHGLNFDDFSAGLKAMLLGEKPAIPIDEAGDLLEQFYAEMEAEMAEKNAAFASQFKEEGEKFLKENATKEGVVTLPSGLQYKVITEGSGKKPKASDKVRCHYEGTFTNGDVFDSSYKRGEPAVFGLNQVIKGWTEGLQLMSEGSKYELYLPYQLAYGEQGANGSIPPCAALKFTVELLQVL